MAVKKTEIIIGAFMLIVILAAINSFFLIAFDLYNTYSTRPINEKTKQAFCEEHELQYNSPSAYCYKDEGTTRMLARIQCDYTTNHKIEKCYFIKEAD